MRVGVRAALEGILLPALCVACDGVLAGGDRGLCSACRSRLFPMSEPCCPRCGVPSDSATETCLGCIVSPPPQEGTVLWGAYDGVLRQAVLALKHRGHDEIARPLGRRLAARIGLAPWFDEITLVASVPSHAIRRLRRGFFASGLIAAEVAATINLPDGTHPASPWPPPAGRTHPCSENAAPAGKLLGRTADAGAQRAACRRRLHHRNHPAPRRELGARRRR